MAVREALTEGAWLMFFENFVADQLEMKAILERTLPLRQEPLTLFGKTHLTPRLVSWHGDPGCLYTYSRQTFAPSPFTPELASLRARLHAVTGDDYNGVLANLYRDGRDSMGWHSDDERELGPRWPEDIRVASISLGARRRFVLRQKNGDFQREFALGEGSLLVMGGATQRDFRHALPRTCTPCGSRLNLTFRQLRLPESPVEVAS